MKNFEAKYVELIADILNDGQIRKGRNGTTKSLFGKTLEIDMSDGNEFPLLLGRKMFYKGIFGEFAALIRGPHHVDDFKAFDCNYWDQWAESNGELRLDYGNAWLNFAGVNQIDQLVTTLKTNPADRRMIVTGWNPAGMDDLSLPCCHLLYQWYVRDDQYLDMMWYQRSCDTMIGLPSDIALAAVWNIMLANNVSLKPGKITMVFGDTHIYKEHYEQAEEYMSRILFGDKTEYPNYELCAVEGMPLELFTPEMIDVYNYNPYPAIKMELKS